jgi:hypothetical protein
MLASRACAGPSEIPNSLFISTNYARGTELAEVPVMTTRRTARLALALVALAAASTSSLARAEIGKTTAAVSVGVTVHAKCSLNELEDSMDVSCDRAAPPRVEQSDVYTVQIGEQQASFTTTTVNF